MGVDRAWHVRFLTFTFFFLLNSLSSTSLADPRPQNTSRQTLPQTLTIAVANSFKPVAEQIAAEYSSETGVAIRIASASSGVLANQLLHGAPFDLFLSADSERPKLLVERGIGLADSRLTYAYGRLVFWWPPGGAHQGGLPDLDKLNQVSRLAIANPRTAPYGEAAQQVLESLGLWQKMQSQLVRGAGASQAYQFVAGGNIAAGLLPLSLLIQGGIETDYLELPSYLYQRMAHQAVVISRGNQALAWAFLRYLMGPGQQAVKALGFEAASVEPSVIESVGGQS
ncbi:molybdate ABC transporter substrate-binding protein [Corallincola platygyrae]|uniref:Molybdate ABC transporter substrate-binding protein n=1 Tax=Corallincola platygyrae TaxID=1193278 RepID=A0ABW4XN68_9GAMM